MCASLCELFSACTREATVVDVSARDGLQAEAVVLSPEDRAEWVRRLLLAGIPEVEAGSFVAPSRVPQMAETARVLDFLGPLRTRCWWLVPNQRGLELAIQAGCQNVVCVVSATETHSRANLGRPIDQVLAEVVPMVGTAAQAQLRARVAVSMAWVDPDEGEVPVERVVEICGVLRGAGFQELTLCDTYGGASPRAVAEVIEALADLFSVPNLGLHLHDTFGFAAANTLVALLAGISRFEASIGGLGGCPFAAGARGNMDMVQLLDLFRSLGIATGIDPESLADATRRCLATLSRGVGAAT